MLTRLPHRVSIMSESRTEFQGACYTSSWVSTSIEWANCQKRGKAMGHQESHEQQKKQQYRRWLVIMREGTDLTNKNRLIFDSKILTIEAVTDPTARTRMIEVTCREEVI